MISLALKLILSSWGTAPVQAANRAAWLNELNELNELQAMVRSLAEPASPGAANYQPEEPGADFRVNIQMSPSSVGRTA